MKKWALGFIFNHDKLFKVCIHIPILKRMLRNYMWGRIMNHMATTVIGVCLVPIVYEEVESKLTTE